MSLYVRPLGAASVVGVAALAIALLVFGITTLRAEATLDPGAPPPLPVAAFEARYSGEARIEEYFAGLVAARRESALGFERGGRIEAVLVDVGDRVEAGQTLARLDMRSLQAQIAAADAQTAEAAAQTALAAETEHRQSQLLERGHISPQRLGEVRTTTQAARARQNAAAAAADALRIQLDLSVIEAPFAGVVTARHADEGAISAPGQALLEIVEVDSLEIRLGLPQAVASGLVPGEDYRFLIDGEAVTGRFRAATHVVNRETRTVSARFDLAPGSAASAGQIARLALHTEIGTDGFWAPTSALAEGRRGLWSVYVLVADGPDAFRLETRMVETVRIEADRVFVRGAVADGELVLASGVQRISPGQLVSPGGPAPQAIAEARVQ